MFRSDTLAVRTILPATPDKTDIMLFDSRRQGNLIFKFGQTNILSVDFHKHLGIVFSSDGKWTRHIDYILSKASQVSMCSTNFEVYFKTGYS